MEGRDGVEPYGAHAGTGALVTRTEYAEERSVGDRAPEVALAFQGLDETYKLMDEYVSQLENRLSPVLRRDDDAEKMARLAEPTPGYSTPLAQRVGGTTDNFQGLNRRLRLLIDRVEV